MKKILLTLKTLLILSTLALAQIADGSFETGANSPVWDETSTNFPFVICDTTDGNCGSANGNIYARTGVKFVWLGGSDGAPETSTIAQSINIPAGDSAFIEIYLRIYATDTLIPNDHFLFYMNADTLLVLDRQDSSDYVGYTLVRLDVSNYANGNSHYFQAKLVQSTGIQMTVNLDDAELIVDGNLVSSLFSGEKEDISGLPYPNPAINHINFDLLSKSRNTKLEIFNLQGKVESEISLEDNHSTTWTVPIDHLNTGKYFYKISSDKGESSGSFNVTK